jgi:1-acyl-sn-glycerol-3-phosphate acyltransferase
VGSDELSTAEVPASDWAGTGRDDGISSSRTDETGDSFGYDAEYERRVLPVLDFLHRHYFRVQSEGIDHLPASGPCLIVGNHTGPLPLAGLVLRSVVRRAHAAHRSPRFLTDERAHELPFVGMLVSRLGAVRGLYPNAERLLRQGELVAAFPPDRSEQRAPDPEAQEHRHPDRTACVRLALTARAPLVPCAVVGASESSALFAHSQALGKLFGRARSSAAPSLSWLGTLGSLPAPAKWRVVLGVPLWCDEYAPDAASDEDLVTRLAVELDRQIQALLENALRRRRSVWFG